MNNIIHILEERGFIDAKTSEDFDKITEKPLAVYCGFDPTSDSLHLGNMVALMGLAWFQKCGHTPIAIIGGATGMIGDPSGKDKEREFLDEVTLRKNQEGIKKNLELFLDFDHPTAKPLILNNYDWFKDFSFLDFLRKVGKNFRMGPMLSKESVKRRLNSEEGLSFTEFSYQALQGYDFLHLYENYNVIAQLGGSDQWGNIIAGTELIKKNHGAQAYGVTFPLLTTASGKKFGKSEKGAIFLSKEKLSPYEFYQYLFQQADKDVFKLMRMLTFMDVEEINKLEKETLAPGYAPNTVQKKLAEEVTKIVHGEEGLQTALSVTKGLKPGSETTLDCQTLELIAADMPSYSLTEPEVLNQKLIDLMVTIKLQTSKGQARKLIRNGGVSVNNVKVKDEDFTFFKNHLIENKLLLIGIGKKNKILIRLDEN